MVAPYDLCWGHVIRFQESQLGPVEDAFRMPFLVKKYNGKVLQEVSSSFTGFCIPGICNID